MNSISDRLRSWLFFKEIEYKKSLNDATELMHDPEFYLDVKNVVRRLQKLEAENKKLRECVEYYAAQLNRKTIGVFKKTNCSFNGEMYEDLSDDEILEMFKE